MTALRHRLALALIGAVLLALSGCAGYGLQASGPAVDAPAYRVGDRWVYHLEDGFRVKTVWDETHEVTAAGPDGITVRVTATGSTVNNVRTEQLIAPGLVKVGAIYDNETRRFSSPLKRYEFPLASGKSWTQWIDDYDETAKISGPINHYVRVGGWSQVTTQAGTFDTIHLYVIARLDDEEFWRYPTICGYDVWYAPAVRGIVREKKEAQYVEKDGALDGGATIRIQSTVVQLVSFTPGRS